MIDLRQLNSNERVDFLIKKFYKSEYNFDIFKMIIEDIQKYVYYIADHTTFIFNEKIYKCQSIKYPIKIKEDNYLILYDIYYGDFNPNGTSGISNNYTIICVSIEDTEKILIESRNKKITDILNYNFTPETTS